MADSLNSSNRVPNGSGASLPNVGAGDVVRPALFNRLAEGIDRATLQFGPGVRVTKTASSSIVSIPTIFGESYPFRAIRVGADGQSFLTFRLGQVFCSYLPNDWRANNTQIRATQAEYLAANLVTKTEGYHAMGSEIMFDVAGTNYLSTKHILENEILQLPYEEGLYYLELCQWSGLQLTPAAGTDADRVAKIATWNAYSLSMKGALKPVIKYANKTSMVAIGYQSKVIPICTVDSYKRVFQCLASDVFLSGSPIRPFTVTITQQGTTGKFAVYPGTVNRIVPKMNDEYLDKSPAPDSVEITDEGYVAIKCTYVADTFFPRTAEVIFISGDTLDGWEDTLTESYFPVAKINKTGSGSTKVFTVIQLSASNLVVNRLKAGANNASWWWDETG